MDKSNRKKRKSKKRKSSKNRIYQLGGGNVNVVLTLKDSNLHYTRQDGSVGGYFDLSNDFNHAVLTESINKLKFASQVHHGESPPYLGMGILTTPLPAMDLVKQINDAGYPTRTDSGEMQVDAIFEMITGTNPESAPELKSHPKLIIHTSLYSQEVAFVLKTLYPDNKISIQGPGAPL